MKKNGEYVGVDEEYVPENEKYVDESLLGNKEKTKKTATSIFKGYIILKIITVIIVIGLMIFIISSMKGMFLGFGKTAQGTSSEFGKTAQGMFSEFGKIVQGMFSFFNENEQSMNISSFNMHIEGMQGTKGTFMLSGYLDDIVTSNKTNKDHIITVIYKETTTTTEEGIVGIKHSLVEDSEYEVSVGYDTSGYINQVTIRDI